MLLSPSPLDADAGATRVALGPKSRVLLTNACGPYRTEWGEAPSDLLGARLARGHAMFQQSSRLPTWALYLIAENLQNDCTVLEFPTEKEFLKELDRGYDVVAIQLMSIHTARVAEMMKMIRERCPGAHIVIGGYGVSTLKQGMPGDKRGVGRYIMDNADHLCRQEGVSFMRRLLGDDVERPVTQYAMPYATVNPFGMKSIDIRLPAISVALGCPSACDFCNTSAFFHHKKIRVASPAQIYDFMKSHQKRLGQDRITFILFDEDIFLDPEFVRELGRLIRSDEKTWGFRWISFGSLNALSSFTARELRECGVEGIWIGVESGILEQGINDTYKKRAAGAPETFEALRKHGIMTIGSMILGFDFHTPDNIEADIDYFVGLRPTFYQVGPIRPCPGTKLYNTLLKQERINDDFNWEDFHLWKEGSHRVKNFEAGALKPYFDLAHEKLRTVNGSPVLQLFEANLFAYETLRDDPSEYLRYQAQQSLDSVRGLYPVVWAMERRPDSLRVRERARALRLRANLHLGSDGLVAGGVRQIASHVISQKLRAPRKPAPEGYKPRSARTHYPSGERDLATLGVSSGGLGKLLPGNLFGGSSIS